MSRPAALIRSKTDLRILKENPNKNVRIWKIFCWLGLVFLYCIYLGYTLLAFESGSLSSERRNLLVLILVITSSLIWLPFVAIYSHYECMRDTEVEINEDQLRVIYGERDISLMNFREGMKIVVQFDGEKKPGFESIISFSFVVGLREICLSIHCGYKRADLISMWPLLKMIMEKYQVVPNEGLHVLFRQEGIVKG